MREAFQAAPFFLLECWACIEQSTSTAFDKETASLAGDTNVV